MVSMKEAKSLDNEKGKKEKSMVELDFLGQRVDSIQLCIVPASFAILLNLPNHEKY